MPINIDRISLVANILAQKLYEKAKEENVNGLVERQEIIDEFMKNELEPTALKLRLNKDELSVRTRELYVRRVINSMNKD